MKIFYESASDSKCTTFFEDTDGTIFVRIKERGEKSIWYYLSECNRSTAGGKELFHAHLCASERMSGK